MKKTIFGVEFTYKNYLEGIYQHLYKFAVDGEVYYLSVFWDTKKILHAYSLNTLPKGTECFEIALLDKNHRQLNEWASDSTYFTCRDEAEYLSEVMKSVVDAVNAIQDYLFGE